MDHADESLLRRCVEGDEHAWSRLVDRYGGLVRSVPREYGFPADVCDDIVQAVFAALVRRIDSIRDPGSLPAWLLVTTRRECWRTYRLRSRERAATLPDESVIEDEDDLLDRLLGIEAVEAALAAMSPRCRDLLTALFLADPTPSYEEIARRLDVPIGSIGPTRLRCLARLANQLGIGNDETGNSAPDVSPGEATPSSGARNPGS